RVTDLHPYRQAEGFSVERLAPNRRAGPSARSLESDRRFYRHRRAAPVGGGGGAAPGLFSPRGPHLIPPPGAAAAVGGGGGVSEVREVPADALLAGTLKPAGAGVAARTKVLYRVLLSKTHDEQRMTVADIVYPYARVTRESVAAVRVLGVRKEVKDLGDMQLLY